MEGLTFKLNILGISISDPARIFCDNQSAVKNSSFLESVPKKKHCSISYHRVREAIESLKCLVYYERSETNLDDLFTKVITQNKRKPLVNAVLYGD